MDDDTARELMERDPEGAALALYRAWGGGVEDASNSVYIPAPPLPRPRPLYLRAAFGLGRGFKFLVFCALVFMRPFVRFALGALALLGGLGVLVLLFVYHAEWQKVMVAAAMGVGAVAVREIYDGLIALVDSAPPHDSFFDGD